MDINIQATIGLCTEFVNDRGKKGEASVVISPLRVTANEEQNRVSVVMGCNMWQSCRNESCWYSVACRQKARPGRESVPGP